MKRLLSTILCLLLVLSISAPCCYADSERARKLADSVLEGQGQMQTLLDTEYTESPFTGEEAFVLCLLAYDRESYDFSAYKNAVEAYLAENTIGNAATRLKAGLVLQALESDSPFLETVVDDSAENMGIMSLIFALHLMTNGAVSKNYTPDILIEKIMTLKLEDNGWAISGKNADVDTTAMCAQALAPYYHEKEEVKLAIDNALVLLSQKQQEDGQFISFGYPNSESMAQVIVLLSCLGIDAENDSRFYKGENTPFDILESYQLKDHSFEHVKDKGSNYMATAEALQAAVSYLMCKAGKGTIFTFGKTGTPELPNLPIENKQDPQPEVKKNPKTTLYIAVGGLTLLGIVLNLVKGKKSLKSYLTVLLIGALAAAAVFFINVEKPDDYYNGENDVDGPAITTNITICCQTILDKTDSKGIATKDKSYIPLDGYILKNAEVSIPEGGNAFDQIIAASKLYKLPIESNSKTKYLSIINYLGEFTYGDLSGWMFRVNGEWSGVGCGDVKLSEGDLVEWIYTCELGADIGNNYGGE